MVRQLKRRQVGGSVGGRLLENMADRVLAVETDRGVLLSPYDATVERALALAAESARKSRNAVRQVGEARLGCR